MSAQKVLGLFTVENNEVVKHVVDFGGHVHSFSPNTEPPEGWRDLTEVLNAITDPNAAILIRGLLAENQNLKERLSVFARMGER